MVERGEARGEFRIEHLRTRPGHLGRVRFWRAIVRLAERLGWRRLARAALSRELSHKYPIHAETFPNVVCTVGKNLMLDTALAGSSYTVTGPFVGLISATSYTGVSASDTMSSHSGWLEAGGTNAPTYSGNRKTPTWASASGGSKATSSAMSFSMTGSGTAKGAFLCYGAGAVSTKDSTAGTLYSAGLFQEGDRAVVNGDTINVSYTTSI